MNTILAVAVPLVIVAVLMGTVLTLAGRESLRGQGVPLPQVRRPDQLLVMMEIGARALHRVSVIATAPRLG